MRVVCFEVLDGVASENQIITDDAADFSVASYLMMQELVDTSDARFAVDVMLKWFKHDGTEDFTVIQKDGDRLSYVWEFYTA